MEEASNKVRPSLPAKYVTLLDLRERWMQQKKKRDEEDRGKELQRNFEVQDDPAAEDEDEGVGDYDKLEQKHQPPEKSLLRSNRNPRSSTRRLSHGPTPRRPTETSNCRWVQVSQPNSPNVLPLNQPKPAPPVQAKQPKSPPVVQIVEAKALPPLDSPKVESEVESFGEIPSFGKMEDEKKRKKPKRKKKRNDEKKDAAQLQPEKGVKENPEQGFEAGRRKENLDDHTRAEIEGKLAGLSLSSGTGEISGGKSMAVRNRRGFRKEKEGGYGKIEGSAMLKERAKRESGLVWVKKGEAS